MRNNEPRGQRDGLHVITEETNETMTSLLLSRHLQGRDSEPSVLKEYRLPGSSKQSLEGTRIQEALREEEEEES